MPPPQETEQEFQAPQALQPPLTGLFTLLQLGAVHVSVVHGLLSLQSALVTQPPQGVVLQAWLEAPLQVVPLQDGAGLLHVLVCIPPPQATEQAPQALQPPLTGLFTLLQLGAIHVSVVHGLLSSHSALTVHPQA